MIISRNLTLLEKALTFIFIFLFFIFSILFTLTNIKEIQSEFTKNRIEFTKKIAHQICGLIENHADINSTLSNILAENSVVYAVVHLRDGSVLGRTNSYALPLEVFEVAESNALKSQFLTFTSFKDSSKRFDIIESAIPIYTNDNTRYILRLGFFKEDEEEQISHLKIRNIIIFSIIFIIFISVRLVKNIDLLNTQYILLCLMSLVMLILFFVSSYLIRKWFVSSWSEKFVSIECINQTKMLIPSAINYIENKNLDEFEKSIKIIKTNNDFEMLSLIKDDFYIYHMDSSKIGERVSNPYYRKSLNTNNPAVFKHENSEDYTAMIPVIEGNNRVGTLYTIWKNIDGYKNLSGLRNRLSIVFVFAYILLYIFLYVFSNEVIKKLSIVSNHIGLNRGISKNNKTFSDKVEVDNELAVSVFIYFKGIVESIKKFDNNQITASVKDCYELAKRLLVNNNYCFLDFRPDGIYILFKNRFEQNSIFDAINFSREFEENVTGLGIVAYSPVITMDIGNFICSNVDKNNNAFLVGDSLVEYKTIAKIQSNKEIIVKEDLYDKIKSLYEFEKIEIISPECGSFNCYILYGVKDTKYLLDVFDSSSDWLKIMILRILKSDTCFDSNVYNDIINKCDENLKEIITFI